MYDSDHQIKKSFYASICEFGWASGTNRTCTAMKFGFDASWFQLYPAMKKDAKPLWRVPFNRVLKEGFAHTHYIYIYMIIIYAYILGRCCNKCRWQDLVPNCGVPMGKGPHGQRLWLQLTDVFFGTSQRHTMLTWFTCHIFVSLPTKLQKMKAVALVYFSWI